MSSMKYKITRDKSKYNDEIYVRKLASYKISMENRKLWYIVKMIFPVKQ